MQANRLRQAEQNLSGIAKRVLDAVPISEPWTVGQICTELGRTGARVEMNVVMGCLRTHVGQGLCKEPRQLTFQRVQIPDADPPTLRVITADTTKPGVFMSKAAPALTSATGDPLGAIGSLAARLREQGRALIVAAEEVERVGLEFEQRVDAAKQGNAKLQALQALLKSINEN